MEVPKLKGVVTAKLRDGLRGARGGHVRWDAKIPLNGWHHHDAKLPRSAP